MDGVFTPTGCRIAITACTGATLAWIVLYDPYVVDSDLQFTIDWTTSGHTGVNVPVTAAGPYASSFTGEHANTYVHDVLAPALTRGR